MSNSRGRSIRLGKGRRNTIEYILQKMTNSCRHSNYYGYVDGGFKCSEISADIIAKTAEKFVFDEGFIMKFLNYVCNSQYDGYYYQNYKCIYKNKDTLINAFNEIAKLSKFTDEHYDKMLQFKEFDKCIITSTENKDFKTFSPEFIKSVIKHRLEHSCDEEADNLIASTTLKNIDYTKDIIYELDV